jgi:class 3 adenylate cyclase
VFGAAGDSVVAEFASTLAAVNSAVKIQRTIEKRNSKLEKVRRMRFRIGINLGDVIVEGGRLRPGDYPERAGQVGAFT